MSDQPHSPHGIGHHLAGLIICLVLTAIPFGVIMFSELHRGEAIVIVIFAGISQLLVQLHFFLGIGVSSVREDKGISLVFAGVLVLIMAGGSLWIMSDLGRRMMAG